jgi:hypothetical protein
VTKSNLPPDVIPAAAVKVEDPPPCTCITAPISTAFRVIVVYSPFCHGNPTHKEAATCDFDPVY